MSSTLRTWPFSSKGQVRLRAQGQGHCSAVRPTAGCVLVTGGCGFIGSAAAEALLARGHDVVLCDSFTEAPYPVAWKAANLEALRSCAAAHKRTLSFFETDCGDLDSVLQATKATHVLHLAALSGLSPGIAATDVFRSNVLSSVSLMESAAKHAVHTVVLASSAAVYGDDGSCGPRLYNETDAAVQPLSVYGASKRCMELAALPLCRASPSLRCRIARLFTIYGPRGRPDMAPWRFIRSMTAGESITLFGNGDAWRDFVYIDDAVQALCYMLLEEGIDEPAGQPAIFNVSSGRSVRLFEFVDAVERATGCTAKRNSLPARPGDVGGSLGNPNKALKMLNWRAHTNLDDGLRRTVEWWRSERANPYRHE